MIVVRWQQGIMGMSAGESEYETCLKDIKVVAIDKSRMKEDSTMDFNEIKEFMDWTLDDQVCLDL
jgi:hypothetical protein